MSLDQEIMVNREQWFLLCSTAEPMVTRGDIMATIVSCIAACYRFFKHFYTFLVFYLLIFDRSNL